MTKNKKDVETNNEKVMTKYDKKMQKRKEEAIKEARTKKITKIVTITVILLAIAAGSIWGVISYRAIHNEFVKINGEAVSGIEFDMYYQISKNETLSKKLSDDLTYGDYFVSYLGYDPTVSDKEQDYMDGHTWYDFFATNTVMSIERYKAFLLDAEKNNYEFKDIDKDYEDFKADLEKTASESGISIKDYYKDNFGKHATEKNLKNFVKEYLKVIDYQENLQTTLGATDEEVEKYYQDNKESLDQVTYRLIAVKAGEEGMEKAQESANNILSLITDEKDFEEQSKLYVTDVLKSTYEENSSLVVGGYKQDMPEAAAEWLLDDARQAADKAVIVDDKNSACYVVYFIKKYYDHSNDEDIKTTIFTNRINELVSSYTDTMTFDDKFNRIKLMK